MAAVNKHPGDVEEIAELSKLTPFSSADFQGEKFARGNMLGGANPLDSASNAPWVK